MSMKILRVEIFFNGDCDIVTIFYDNISPFSRDLICEVKDKLNVRFSTPAGMGRRYSESELGIDTSLIFDV